MKIRRQQRGQSLLETAMMVVVIFTVTFWIFELGWLMYTYTVMADAANEGVRFAVVNSTDKNLVADTKAKATTFARASLHNVNSISVDVSPSGGPFTPPNTIQVTVTYTYVPWLSHYINTPTMKTYAKGTIVR